jgi:hypothetical protein
MSVDAGIGLQSLRVLRAAGNSVPLPPRCRARRQRHPPGPDIARHLYRRTRRPLLVPLDVLEVTAIAEQTPNLLARDARTARGRVRPAGAEARLAHHPGRRPLRAPLLRRPRARAARHRRRRFSNRHAELFDEAEADELFAPRHTVGEYHHMGTTRMHDDVRHGVVDRTASCTARRTSTSRARRCPDLGPRQPHAHDRRARHPSGRPPALGRRARADRRRRRSRRAPGRRGAG